MESPTPQPAPGSATFMEGCKDSLPIVISYIPVAFAFGLNATPSGILSSRKRFFLLHHLCRREPVRHYRDAWQPGVVCGLLH
ncbi:AzlC-like membrane protein [Escherichia coli]|uniref:AzlC-like membrane protein n=1 Tax=Escherichia coli TaxID=562 RepID=A0A377AHW7_ECOLX|nr:AzlC-like membrane protein [Escherichia coli]